MSKPSAPGASIRHESAVRIVRRHHSLVRLSHWINVPLLLGLIVSGLAIYWAAPVFLGPVGPDGQRTDLLARSATSAARALHLAAGDPRVWFYSHFSLGPQLLAESLNLHWLLAYLFIANGLLYLVGLVAGGGWRALVPRGADARDSLRMVRYYLGVVPMRLLRRPWPHPVFHSKYNALQRAAYLSVPLASFLVVLSGWAMHKPAQLGWLERLFGGYDTARVVHFACMVVLAVFVIPHVVLVIADGWDTFRSMITGWSTRVREENHD